MGDCDCCFLPSEALHGLRRRRHGWLARVFFSGFGCSRALKNSQGEVGECGQKKKPQEYKGRSFRVFELMTWRVGIGFWSDWTVLMGFMKIGLEGGPLIAHEIPDKQKISGP